MKITCPNCSARYEVELPGLTGRDVRVKCVKCQQKFLVDKVESSPQPSRPMPSPVAAGTALGSEETLETPANSPGKTREGSSHSAKQASAANNRFSEEASEKSEDFSTATFQNTESQPETSAEDNFQSTADDTDPAPKDISHSTVDDADSEIEPAADPAGKAGEDPLDAFLGTDMDNDAMEVEIDPLDLDQEIPPFEVEDATDSGEEKKDDLDDLLDQILEGKLQVDDASSEDDAAAKGSRDTAQPGDAEDTGSAKDRQSEESFSDLEMGFEKVEPAGTSPDDMPFLEDSESEGKSEVDRWAEAFAEEGLDQSMEEDLNSLGLDSDCSLEHENREEAPNETAFEQARKNPDVEDVAGEVSLLKKSARKSELAEEEDASREGTRKKAGLIQARKKKNGLFALPATRTGKVVFFGVLLTLALGAGALYMLQETLLPEEIMNFRNTVAPQSPAPEAGQMKAPEQAPPPAGAPHADAPAAVEASKPTLPNKEDAAPATVVKAAAPETKTTPEVVKELSAIAPENGAEENEPGLELSDGLLAALSPRKNAVTLSTIIPVAYSASEIRVLSFNLVMELTDQESAEAVREALPIFENATVDTIDSLLENKFFNDILYVKEKMKTELKTAFNDIIVGGRVKRVQFEDFLVQ